MTAAAPRPAIGRAAFIGIVLSCALGGGFLLVRAALLSRVDCAGMLQAECTSAHQTASQLSTLHASAGLALCLIGGGLVLYARSKAKEP